MAHAVFSVAPLSFGHCLRRTVFIHAYRLPG